MNNTAMHRSQHSCQSMSITSTSEHFSENQHPHLWTTSPPSIYNDHKKIQRRRGNRPSAIKATVPPQVLAKMHNNHGVKCIECGNYDEAISSLVKAFKFSQAEKQEKGCDCSQCNLHNIIASNTSSSSNSAAQHDILQQDEGDVDGFLYSSGICIPKECHGHSMGNTFQIIVSFNLALANHLLWRINKDDHDQKRLKRIMRLYELAYYLQIEDSDMVNVKLTIIIVNNLSQIHHDLKNYEKYRISLEHLLANLMLVANYQRHPSLAEGSSQNDMKLDGFFANASRLILLISTAAAA